MTKKTSWPLAILLVLMAQIVFNLSLSVASEDDPADVLETRPKDASTNSGNTLYDAVTSPNPEPTKTPIDNTPLSVDPLLKTEPLQTELVQTELVHAPLFQPALELLGSKVEPGEASLLKWAFEETFVDTSAPVSVLVVNGTEPGPTLCLTAAIHGDELNGIEVVRRVVHEIDPNKLSGAVIGVPIVNLPGFRRASRYLPDRRDLNRYFPGNEKGSYASRIAHSFFTNIIEHCDYLIDIHTGSLSRTNLPQIRANLLLPEVASLAEKMGSIVVLQSIGATGTLRRAAAQAGVPAVTLETGAPNNLQKEAVEEGVKSVLNAMSSLGLSASKSFWKLNEEPVFYQSTWIRARQGGILFSKIELGDTVKKGNVLGLLSDPITNKTVEIIAPIEGRVIGMALNQVMHPGFAAYHIGLKSSAVEAAQPSQLIPDEAIDDISAAEIDDNTLADNTDLPNQDAEQEADSSGKSPIEEMVLPTIDEK